MELQRGDIRHPVMLVGSGQVAHDRERPKSAPQVRAPRSQSVTKAEHGGADDEAELVARTAGGDRDAFRELLNRHLGLVVASAARIVNDVSEAEDIAQETFVKLWGGAQTLEIGAAGVRPWLVRVSRNLSIDRLRATRRLEVVDEVPDEGQDAEQDSHLEAHDRASRVAQAIAALPDRQRLAIVLFHYEELSQTEIATKLECSVDATESLLARARRNLKAALEQDWQELLDVASA